MIDMAVIMVVLLAVEDSPRNTGAEIAALDARREIQSGHMLLEYFHLSGSGVPTSTIFEFYFDGDRHFLKKVDQGLQEAYPASVVPSTTRTIKTPEAIMSHRVDNNFQGRRFAAFVDDRARIEAVVQKQPELREHLELESELVFDPRLIGMAPFSIGRFYKKRLDSYLCGPRMGEPKVQHVAVQSQTLAHLTIDRSSDERFEAWIDETRGFVPVRMKLTTGNSEDEVIQIETMEADVEQFRDGLGVRWFPSHLSFTLQSRAGDVTTVLECEEILVLSAEFNFPVPEHRFTLKALDLPENTLIIHRPDPILNGQRPAEPPFTGPRLQKWHESKATPLTPEDYKLRRLASSSASDNGSVPGGGQLTAGRLVFWNLVGLGTGLIVLSVYQIVTHRKSGGNP